MITNLLSRLRVLVAKARIALDRFLDSASERIVNTKPLPQWTNKSLITLGAYIWFLVAISSVATPFTWGVGLFFVALNFVIIFGSVIWDDLDGIEYPVESNFSCLPRDSWLGPDIPYERLASDNPQAVLQRCAYDTTTPALTDPMYGRVQWGCAFVEDLRSGMSWVMEPSTLGKMAIGCLFATIVLWVFWLGTQFPG